MASQLNTARFNALRAQLFTGATNEMLVAYLNAHGATSKNLSTAWFQALRAVPLTGHRNDMWFARLRSKGYTGSILDMEKQFWTAGGIW
jgi:hypothetical protein